MWILPVVAETVDKVKIAAGIVKEKLQAVHLLERGARGTLAGVFAARK